MKRLLAISALLFASSAFAAQDLTGPWTIHYIINGNGTDEGCHFVVTNNNITGACRFLDKDRQVTGTVVGNKVTLQHEAEYNNFTFTLLYTGTVDDSGKIAGTVLVKPFNVDGIFTAIRGTAPSQSASAGWGKFPTRDPHTPGFVAAKDLPDGANAPVNADGNFVLGPTHTPAPEVKVEPGIPQGKVIEFVMNSTDSKIYPGIARDPGTFGTPDPADPAKLIVTTSHPSPYTRHGTVYVPSQYEPGTTLPFIVGTDGPDRILFPILENLITQHRIPVMVAISIGSGGGDAQGSERGLEYNTMSGLYAKWVEKEVLP